MIVVDASVLVDALGGDGARGSAARARLASEPYVAVPDIADLETISALRRRWLAGLIDEEQLLLAADDLGSLPAERHHSLSLIPRALELRHTVTVADALYIALAEKLGLSLLTADRRLAGAPGIRGRVGALG